MSHTERIGQLVHEHHYLMLAGAAQRPSRLGRQLCDLAVASRQSRPGGAP